MRDRPVSTRHPGIPMHQLKVFPNPTKDILNITNPELEHIPNSGYVLDAFTLDGKRIWQQRLDNWTTAQIDCNNWIKGTYLITVSSKTIQYRGYFIKI